MTPADERILKLLAKWRTSLDLHAGYSRLGDDQYWLVQPWPKHQRPTPWVIQLAQQRLADLERIVKTRLAAGDTSISEALELMSFMANLVGTQNVERFVPIAEPEQERPITRLREEARPDGAAEPAEPAPAQAAQAGQGAAAPDGGSARPRAAPAGGNDTTREMVVPGSGADSTREMPVPGGRADATREMPALAEAVAADSTAEMPAPARARPAPPDAPPPEDERELEVVRDAVRLLGWGREWHELPEAIARMAGRPDKRRVRGILQSHRASIERAAGAAARTH